MLKKILLLSASAGAGHVRAAQALEKAFKETLAGDIEVNHFDVLNYTNKVFRHLYSKAYIDLVNKMPEVPGWVYDKLDTPWKNERRRLALDKLNTRPFVKLLREYNPDLIVCTHFLPAEIFPECNRASHVQNDEIVGSEELGHAGAGSPEYVPNGRNRVGRHLQQQEPGIGSVLNEHQRIEHEETRQRQKRQVPEHLV